MISFPWALDDFFGGLRIASASFFLPDSMVSDTQGDGQIVTANLGQRLWSGSVQMVPGYYRTIAALEARVSIIREAGRPFFVFPPHKAFPLADPDGATLGALVPVTSAIPSARTLSLAGLPAGYVISAGDFLSFAYGASPVRQALHQVVAGGVASGVGALADIEVTPAIRPGVGVGVPVRLVRPFCKAVYVPGSYRAGAFARGLGGGVSFDFRQTLR